MDECTFECPMDISVRPMDEWTFLFAQWTFIYVQWTNGHFCLPNGHLFNVQWTCNVYNAKEAVMT